MNGFKILFFLHHFQILALVLVAMEHKPNLMDSNFPRLTAQSLERNLVKFHCVGQKVRFLALVFCVTASECQQKLTQCDDKSVEGMCTDENSNFAEVDNYLGLKNGTVIGTLAWNLTLHAQNSGLIVCSTDDNESNSSQRTLDYFVLNSESEPVLLIGQKSLNSLISLQIESPNILLTDHVTDLVFNNSDMLTLRCPISPLVYSRNTRFSVTFYNGSKMHLEQNWANKTAQDDEPLVNLKVAMRTKSIACDAIVQLPHLNDSDFMISQTRNLRVDSAQKCYVCNSAYHPQCGDTGVDPKYLVLCSPRSFAPNHPQFHEFLGAPQGTDFTFCRKMIFKIPAQKNSGKKKKSETRIIRSCGYEDDPDQPIPGCQKKGNGQIRNIFCQCRENGCNPATTIHHPSTVLYAAKFILTGLIIAGINFL